MINFCLIYRFSFGFAEQLGTDTKQASEINRRLFPAISRRHLNARVECGIAHTMFRNVHHVHPFWRVELATGFARHAPKIY